MGKLIAELLMGEKGRRVSEAGLRVIFFDRLHKT